MIIKLITIIRIIKYIIISDGSKGKNILFLNDDEYEELFPEDKKDIKIYINNKEV